MLTGAGCVARGAWCVGGGEWGDKDTSLMALIKV